MAKRCVRHIGKTINVAQGIKVICGSCVTESHAGFESGRDYLYLITKRGTEILDNSPYFIDLKSAILEGNEIVIKWIKQERCFEEKQGDYERWIEEVTRPRECEKRISLT